MELTDKVCKACEGTEKPFTKEEIGKYLPKVKNWKLINNKIEKEFTFKNFQEALDFMNKVGKLSEKEGHHPDILLHDYKKVKIMLTTHAISGLSENDFIMAAKIDKI